MDVRKVTTWSDLANLEREWNALAAGEPLRSWDWLATWWKHYGGSSQPLIGQAERPDNHQLHVLCVYDNERLVGIAPWYLGYDLVNGTVLRWLGSGEVCTDHLSLICNAPVRQPVANAVAESLAAESAYWDRLDLVAVDAEDEAVIALVAELERRECLVSQHSAGACWVLELPTTWDDYLAALSKSHRKQLRQLERRVLETSRAKWWRAETPVEFEAGWEILVDLHQRRRQSLGEPGCFASRKFHAFHHEVAGRLLKRGQLRLSWFELDGAPVAAEYHVVGPKATYAYQGGVDPDRLDEEPGRLSTILSLRQAIEEVHTSFDFLRGDEPYKAHWRATPRATCDYRIVPNRTLARIRGRVLDITNSVTEWMRHSVKS